MNDATPLHYILEQNIARSATPWGQDLACSVSLAALMPSDHLLRIKEP
jgi:hypothetical protein